MSSVAHSGIGSGRSTKVDKTRRSWSAQEEEVLIQSMKEVVTKGWRSENGFRAGYLILLENAMKTAIPGTSLRGNPHINSKVHVWKKTYSSLVTLLSKSGVGWNDVEKMIDATEETWEAIVKEDPSLRAMRLKQWTYYSDWCEIFGNDRAAGERTKDFDQAWQKVLALDKEKPNEDNVVETDVVNSVTNAEDSISETQTKTSKTIAAATSKSRKRKQPTDTYELIVDAIKELSHVTKDTMSNLIIELHVEEKLCQIQDKVLDTLQGLHEFSEDEQVVAAKLLFNNHNDLALFKRLGGHARICFLKRLLRGE
ncbi:uncharacterized protein [Henckelia pumila]|uniref:uncharacterized protein n=1 Tax=Henckelia pumila TaxID=405737 RepID=UPI003C6DEE0D